MWLVAAIPPMTHLSQPTDIAIRPVQYTDLELVNRFCAESAEGENLTYSINPEPPVKPTWFTQGPFRLLGILFNRPQIYGAYLTEADNRLQGMVQVSPFNRTRTTWRIDRVAAVGFAAPTVLEPMESFSAESESEQDLSLETEKAIAPSRATVEPEEAPVVLGSTLRDIGSLLLRHCFSTILEARTWLLEVNTTHNSLIALFRQNGFQPLAQMTYWAISPALLQELAEREPDLPNLLPVSNADAQLLYQLDTMSMPPLVRQVFDRHLADFKTSLVGSLIDSVKHWLSHVEVVSGYVFEPQRKAAIGYFQLQLCRDGSHPHQAQLTVNPAYTWLYPELMSQIARITQDCPTQTLYLASSDYQPEREEYLERLGAARVAHTLMMSRSVWHKVRESKLAGLENLQLPEVLQGLQPSRKAIPSRIARLKPTQQPPSGQSQAFQSAPPPLSPPTDGSPRKSAPRLNLSPNPNLPDLPPQGPCC
jgi:hypothetical protein